MNSQEFLDGLVTERRIAPKLVWLLGKCQDRKSNLEDENAKLKKALDGCAKCKDQYEAEVKRLNQLVFAYESVEAPVNPLLAENAKLREEITEIYRDLVAQNCTMHDGKLDSMAISTNANAMRFLAKQGDIIIERECSRRVIGKWTKPSKENNNGL